MGLGSLDYQSSLRFLGTLVFRGSRYLKLYAKLLRVTIRLRLAACFRVTRAAWLPWT